MTVEGMTMVTTEKQVGVRSRLWTKREYYRMGELGFFRGQRVELMEGRIAVLSPQNAPHWTDVDRVRHVLQGIFGTGFLVRMQGPLDLGKIVEPEPDVCVVSGRREDYEQAHPTSAVLIVEVSDSTLSYDRRRKSSLYASADIEDYWIVNLVARQLEVYRAPRPDARRHFGYRYSSRTDLMPPATVSPLALPQVVIPVADLLPAAAPALAP
jgi:Uma2 family endonuclease